MPVHGNKPWHKHWKIVYTMDGTKCLHYELTGHPGKFFISWYSSPTHAKVVRKLYSSRMKHSAFSVSQLSDPLSQPSTARSVTSCVYLHICIKSVRALRAVGKVLWEDLMLSFTHHHTFYSSSASYCQFVNVYSYYNLLCSDSVCRCSASWPHLTLL